MNPTTSRREFLSRNLRSGLAMAGLGLAGAARIRAIEPFDRPGQPRLSLSLAAYSFRESFKNRNQRRRGPIDPKAGIDMFQFVDYCANQGCQGSEVTSYYFPEQVTQDYLLELKRHAFLRGIELSGTAIGNTFTLPKGDERDAEIASAKQWIDRAAVLGAPHIRVFAGGTEGQPLRTARKLCIEALEECGDYAAQHGVMLGLENHGGIVSDADGILEIIRSANSPGLGISLDTGNFHTDDPYADLVRCAPYAVNVQLKANVRPRNGPGQPADLERLTRILRQANYQGYVALEYEEENPWEEVPRYLDQLKALFRA